MIRQLDETTFASYAFVVRTHTDVSPGCQHICFISETTDQILTGQPMVMGIYTISYGANLISVCITPVYNIFLTTSPILIKKNRTKTWYGTPHEIYS